MGPKASKHGEVEGIDSKFYTGQIVYFTCSMSPGIVKIEKIEWWDNPMPELGKLRLPWYRIKNIDNGVRGEEFESNLHKDSVGMLLYG